WSGSPATPHGPADARVSPPAGGARRLAVGLALAFGALLLPLVAILPIAPGLVALIELDWRSEGYTYLLLAPALA
ncbi:hypothetical protein ACSTI9_00150, partial [Vibrio parahaemolyticus]